MTETDYLKDRFSQLETKIRGADFDPAGDRQDFAILGHARTAVDGMDCWMKRAMAQEETIARLRAKLKAHGISE